MYLLEEVKIAAEEAVAAKLASERENPEEEAGRNWKADVRQAAQELASEAWDDRDEDGALQRADEIRRLVDAQIRDDTNSTGIAQRDRIGRSWVAHWDVQDWSPFMPHEVIWPRYSDDQVSLQTALTALLDISLEPEERVLIRLVYDGGLTQREVASQLKLSQPAVKKRLDKIYEKLRGTLLKAYGKKEEIA